MRHVPITLGMTALALACSACGDVAEPGARPEARPTDAAGATLQTFTLSLERAPTPETIVSQMVAAAHAQLAAACTEHPDAVVRVLNPLLPGSHADVPCTEILNGGAAVDEAGEMLTNERIGEVGQELSPVSLVCGLLMLGAASAFNWPWGNEGCNNPRANDRTACQATTSLGFGILGFFCSFI